MELETNTLFFSDLNSQLGLGGLCSSIWEFTESRSPKLSTWDGFFDQLERYCARLERFTEESQPLIHFEPFASEQDFVSSGIDLLATIGDVSQFYRSKVQSDMPKLSELLEEFELWADEHSHVLAEYSEASENSTLAPTPYDWTKLENVASGLATLNRSIRDYRHELVVHFRNQNMLFLDALSKYVPDAPVRHYDVDKMSVTTVVDSILVKLRSIAFDIELVSGFETVEPIQTLMDQLASHVAESEEIFNRFRWARTARIRDTG